MQTDRRVADAALDAAGGSRETARARLTHQAGQYLAAARLAPETDLPPDSAARVVADLHTVAERLVRAARLLAIVP